MMEKETLYRYTGNESQLFGVRRTQLQEGPGKGATLLEVTTAGGLQADILADSGLDIGLARYKGVNISYLAKNGYDSPARFLPYESEFLHTFPGGLLYTCGLRSVGAGNRDGEEWHPFHGRYHGIAADNVSAMCDGENITISGTMRESALFGHLLRLHRRITIPAFGASIEIEDTLENLTPAAEEFMLLYHCNFGYPLLSETARLVLPEGRKTTARTPFAENALGRECSFDKPADGEEERVFFHQLPTPRARLENPAVGVAATLEWSADTLPLLAQWRSMASGDYALGLEPTNNNIMGRAAERTGGTLLKIGPFQKQVMRLKVSCESI